MTHNPPHPNPLRRLTLAALGRVGTMAALLALLAFKIGRASCRERV